MRLSEWNIELFVIWFANRDNIKNCLKNAYACYTEIT